MSASIETLQKTAIVLASLREYFAELGVMEVMTPVLSSYAVTDPNIESLAINANQTAGSSIGQKPLYLHTSPEYAMKRLLVAGSGDIYQICRVFRSDPPGRLHNPEFTMLEWYRTGVNHKQLSTEVDQLLSRLWGLSGMSATVESLPPTDYLNYTELVENVCGCPFSSITADTISKILVDREIQPPSSMFPVDDEQLDDWLDLALSLLVIPAFKKDRFTCLSDYPASQAALARTSENRNGQLVAERFEFFYGEVEIANGYHELQDATEHRARFEHDLMVRGRKGLASPPIDVKLLAAIDAGLPDCAGVALGLERLIMLLLGKSRIEEVMIHGASDV